MTPRRQCVLIKAPVVDYYRGLAIQTEAHDKVGAGVYDGALILLEHHPVITIGRGGGVENLCSGITGLRAAGIEVVHTDRGGNVTCHNPGQLVGYPVINLKQWREDVHWHVHALEEVLIRVLARLGLHAGRKAKYTGVWLDDEKIAAIGVSVRHWITGHGFALNMNNDLGLFRYIVPCGIREFGVTSLVTAGITADMPSIVQYLTEEFAVVYDCLLEA